MIAQVAVKDRIAGRLAASGCRCPRVFSVRDFVGLGSRESIRMALSRLVADGVITRISTGIYWRADISLHWSDKTTFIDCVAKALAERSSAKIGLFGQVQAAEFGWNVPSLRCHEYLSDGASSQIVWCGRTIKISPVGPKVFSLLSTDAGRIVQAIHWCGIDQAKRRIAARAPHISVQTLAQLELINPFLTRKTQKVIGALLVM